MEFIANALNGNFLTNILPTDEDEVEGVLAAIAYGDDKLNDNDSLLGNCISNGFKLDIWMRYDHTVPVSVNLLKKLLRSHSKNIYCKLIPDCLHSKLIWWKGYGAYIGSANLTRRAWFNNIETGLFLTNEELIDNSLDIQFEDFFENLENTKQAFPLTQEIINEMQELHKIRGNRDQIGKDKRSSPYWGGPTNLDKKSTADRRKANFKKEWLETLSYLRDIGNQLNDYRPSWVNEDIPDGWHADQFLHAYYYNKVSDGRQRPYWNFHEKNKSNPQAALVEAMRWWQNEPTPPSHEDKTLYQSAPFIQSVLSRENISKLTLDQFIEVCGYTHATEDHIIKFPLELLGKGEIKSMSQEKRIPVVSEWIWNQRNEKGWNVAQLLSYVLYGGKDTDLWERLYNSGREPEYRIKRYGLNSIAEVIGWARPDISPPRNGRTSKGLRALGYSVEIYT